MALELENAVGTVEVDEVSLGSWQTPVVHDVSPSEWPGYEAPQLSIIGQNFVATPAVFLAGMELANVTWVSTTLLTADDPLALAGGAFTLMIVNANGSTTSLPDAIRVTWHQALLPTIVRDARGVSWETGGDWPTLGHHVAHTGHNNADAGASRYALVWTTILPIQLTVGLELVAVADGIVVASNEGALFEAAVVALDAETGAEIWREPFSGNYYINPPSIAHGAVYFQKGVSDGWGHLFCLDLYTGTRHWRAPFYSRKGDYLAPIVVEDAVYAPIYKHVEKHLAGTGQFVWPHGAGDYLTWTPAFADGVLYTWTEGSLRAYSPATGFELWSLELGWSGTRNYINTTPVIAEGRAIVASSTELNVVNLSAQDVAWTLSGNYADNVPAVADGVVYALSDGKLEARRLSNGELLWSIDGLGLKNAPVVAGEYVCVASDTNTYVLNRTTHEVERQTDGGGWLAVADGFLYIAQQDFVISAYRAQEP